MGAYYVPGTMLGPQRAPSQESHDTLRGRSINNLFNKYFSRPYCAHRAVTSTERTLQSERGKELALLKLLF